MRAGASIFAGTAVSSEPGTNPAGLATLRYTFQVNEALYGLDASRGRVTVEVDAFSSCAMTFDIGARYLVYANEGRAGLVTTPCSRTRRLDEARADLDALRDANAGVVSGRLTGRVLDSWLRLEPTGARLAGDNKGAEGIDVEIRGPSGRRRVSTGPDGWFTLTRLRPGRYTVVVRPPPNRVADLSPAEVVVGSCGTGALLVTAARSFEARVVHDDGTPVRAGVRLSLVSEVSDAPLQQAPRAWTETDDRGRASLAGLRPGRYRLGVSVLEPPAAGTPYPATWYGGADAAAVVEISDQRTTRVVMRLPQRLPSRTISGTITDAAGRAPAGNPFVWVFDRDDPTFRVATVSAVLGRFTFEGVAGRRYTFQAGHTAVQRSARVDEPADPAQPVTLVLPD